jgi:heme o synthase
MKILPEFASIHSRCSAPACTYRESARHLQNGSCKRKMVMESTAIAISLPQVPSRSSLTARLAYFASLMKPRVMLLAVFTALVGLVIAPGRLDPLLGSVALLAIAAGAGAAGALNMWYDADIDALMARTAGRAIPCGRISRGEALAFGLALAGSSVAILALAVNVKAAGLLAFTIVFYVVVYTVWLKRSTPQNIVIGGAAGALPPVIGWTAATGDIGLEPLILFLIIFLWTPPHFWALSLTRTHEYARAGVPMLPVIAGRAATTRQILIYSVLLLPISLLPWTLGFAGTIYGAAAVACGAPLALLAWQLRKSGATDRRAAHRLFAFSIVHLFVLFAALLADDGTRWPSGPYPHAAQAGIGSAPTDAMAPFLRSSRGSSEFSPKEV